MLPFLLVRGRIMLELKRLAARLGGDIAGANTILCPGPGHSPRDRSLAVKFSDNAPAGFTVFSHAGDSWAHCRDHVRARLGLPPWRPGDEQERGIAPQHVARWDFLTVEGEADDVPTSLTEDELTRIAAARRLWNEGQDPRGTLVQTYLNEHRKLALPDELANSVLRFHERTAWRDENTGMTIHVPALIAPFRSVKDNSINGVHRIALQPDGSKRGRRMLGVTRRAAVMLDPAGEVLGVGEGIETVLAGRELGLAPAVWACGSTGSISFLPLIDGVSRLIIFAENDGGASAQASSICSQRWRNAGRKVRVIAPSNGHCDFNDALIAERTAS